MKRPARMVGWLSAMAVAAATTAAILGYSLTADEDAERESLRRQALGAALAELRAAGAGFGDLGPEQVAALADTSGIAGLRIERQFADTASNVIPVLDGDGRIVTWLTWNKDRASREVMDRLAPFLALAALCGLGLGCVALRMQRASTRSAHRDLQPAEVDWLTGMPNQYAMRGLVTAAIEGRAPDETIAYAIIDIDRFEEASQALGGTLADQLLAEFATRLQEAFAPGVVGRLSGDCFAMIATVPDAEAAQRLAEAACRVIARPYRIAPGVQLTAGIGVTLVPRDGVDRSELARRALLAMHRAKQSGRNKVVMFSSDLESGIGEKHFIKRELATALADHSLDVHYQPIFTADGATVLGVEALLRWTHAERGAIHPALFVPIAEQAGLMDRLGQYVLRRALADAGQWPELFVAVNLSPLQVRDPAFVRIVSSLLREAQFEPSRLVLEVTEGVLIDNPDETKARLEELRALGVRLALDDFGSGYSSLNYLQRLPFDKLKIDRAFVGGLSTSANGGVIIQAVIALGRALGMSVLVEGVETEEQRKLLRLAGCEEMQGYLFSRAVPRGEITAMLAANRDPRAALRSSA